MKPPVRTENNFDFLRLVAALMVFGSHSFPIYGLPSPTMIEPPAGYKSISFGVFGVSIFFAISGFLIAQSYFNTGNIKIFVTKRFFRILPAYIVNMLLTILLLGSVASSLGVVGYFSELKISAISNMLFLESPAFLPGVFAEAALYKINGSLWTLKYEVLCYILLVVVLKTTGKKAFWIWSFVILLINAFFWPVADSVPSYIHIASFFVGAFIYI